jgi:hypothetical protein
MQHNITDAISIKRELHFGSPVDRDCSMMSRGHRLRQIDHARGRHCSNFGSKHLNMPARKPNHKLRVGGQIRYAREPREAMSEANKIFECMTGHWITSSYLRDLYRYH